MGEAFLDYKKGGNGLDINGIIQDYYVYAGENVSAGDFVEFINGVAKSVTETSSTIPIDTTDYAGYLTKAVELSNNRVFLVHSFYQKGLYGIICTIKGTTIEYGTDTVLSTATKAGANAISLELLDNDKVFVAYNYDRTTYALYGMICTIYGTTITKGTETALQTNSKSAFSISTKLLSDNKIFIAHCYGGSFYLQGTVCTVSGTSMSLGVSVTLQSTTYAGRYIAIGLLENGTIFIAHDGTQNSCLHGTTCTVSGTTISAVGTKQLNDVYRTGSSQGTNVIVLDSERVFVAHGYQTDQYLSATIVRISGTSIQEWLHTRLNSTVVNTGRCVPTLLLPNGKILIIYAYSSSYYLYGMICTVDGMTVTCDTETQLNSNEKTAYYISTLLLNSGNVFVAHTYGGYTLYAQLFSIDEANNIPTNNVTVTEYETQVRPATLLPCNGVASTSGVGGTSTAHNQQVSVYIPSV